MDHTKMPMSEVLTPDEKLVADFIKTRTKKVLDDIQWLSKGQNAEQELAEYIDSDGNLTVYRGSFERPFGREDDASRVIEKGFAFSLDREVAKNYATCWFPETAKIYEVKAPLSDVAWYSNYDEEKTVILLPQNKGGHWTVASEEVVPSSEYGSDSEKAVAVQAYASTFKRK